MTSVKITRTWIGVVDTQFGSKDKCAIKCEQLGEEWLSTFKITPAMREWKEGDTVDINVTKKKSKDGTKMFYNFEEGMSLGAGLGQMPAQPSQPKEEVIQLEEEDDVFKF